MSHLTAYINFIMSICTGGLILEFGFLIFADILLLANASIIQLYYLNDFE